MSRLLEVFTCYDCKHRIEYAYGDPARCSNTRAPDEEYRELPRHGRIPDWCRLPVARREKKKMSKKAVKPPLQTKKKTAKRLLQKKAS